MIQIHKKAFISTFLTVIGSILFLNVIINIVFYISKFIDFRELLVYLIVTIMFSTYLIIALLFIYVVFVTIYDSFIEYYNKKELKGE